MTEGERYNFFSYLPWSDKFDELEEAEETLPSFDMLVPSFSPPIIGILFKIGLWITDMWIMETVLRSP